MNRKLAGLPQNAVERAAADAREANQVGWLFKLDQPTYMTVMTSAQSERLRRDIYEAWITRSSDTGPTAGKFDNGPLIEKIMPLRHEAAQLAGFKSYADFALATRMAKSSAQVLDFPRRSGTALPLRRGARFRRPGELCWTQAVGLGRGVLHRMSEGKPLQGLAGSAAAVFFRCPKSCPVCSRWWKRLYGVRVQERPASVWHASVRYYDLIDAAGKPFAGFYLDPYSRTEKRSGAWMDECVVRKALPSGDALPIAQLVCNFTAPVNGRPSLLTHDEVTTLFHEFGHGLHHMLTRVSYPSVAGINGVPWDAVELPSQFMENFAWRTEVLPLISAHVDSGEPLPARMLERLLGTRTFGAALDTVRQLELACFDFELHANFDPAAGARVQENARGGAQARCHRPTGILQPAGFELLRTFSPAAMRPATTATNGRRC